VLSLLSQKQIGGLRQRTTIGSRKPSPLSSSNGLELGPVAIGRKHLCASTFVQGRLCENGAAYSTNLRRL
jgi:hypothetical protein